MIQLREFYVLGEQSGYITWACGDSHSAWILAVPHLFQSGRLVCLCGDAC